MTVAALAVGASLGGCGGGGDSTPADVIERFAAAAADGDGEAACNLMTGPAQRSLLLGSCVSGIQEASESFGEEEKRALRSVIVRDVRINGDRATIADSDVSSEEGQLPPETDSDPTVLERIEGQWKITDPG